MQPKSKKIQGRFLIFTHVLIITNLIKIYKNFVQKYFIFNNQNIFNFLAQLSAKLILTKKEQTMVFNYYQIMPLEISNSDLDEYEKYLGKSLNDEDREVILKFTSFRRVLTIRKKLKL